MFVEFSSDLWSFLNSVNCEPIFNKGKREWILSHLITIGISSFKCCFISSLTWSSILQLHDCTQFSAYCGCKLSITATENTLKLCYVLHSVMCFGPYSFLYLMGVLSAVGKFAHLQDWSFTFFTYTEVDQTFYISFITSWCSAGLAQVHYQGYYCQMIPSEWQ